MDGITVKELADELETSKTTIYKTIDDLQIRSDLQMFKNRYLLSEEQAAAVRTQFREQKSESESQTANRNETKTAKHDLDDLEAMREAVSTLQSMVDVLQDQLRVKDDQIQSLQNQLENMTAALRDEQALHAGSMKKQLEPVRIEQPERQHGWFWRLFHREDEN